MVLHSWVYLLTVPVDGVSGFFYCEGFQLKSSSYFNQVNNMKYYEKDSDVTEMMKTNCFGVKKNN